MSEETQGSSRRIQGPITPVVVEDKKAIRAESILDVRSVFPRWDDIVEAAREEYSATGHQLAGGYKQLEEDQRSFFEMVSNAVNRKPELGVRPNQMQQLVELLSEHFFGLGLLSAYLKIDGLEEISLNKFDEMYLTVYGVTKKIDSPFRSDKEVKQFLDAVFAQNNREINDANPAQDGYLKDGSRIHADLPPLAVLGPCFSIRKFRDLTFTMDDYRNSGAFTSEFEDAVTWAL